MAKMSGAFCALGSEVSIEDGLAARRSRPVRAWTWKGGPQRTPGRRQHALRSPQGEES